MENVRIDTDGRKTLKQLLEERDFSVASDCGGRGSCGKCRIRILEGAPEPTEREKELISREKLAQGWRLACCCRPKGEIIAAVSRRKEQISGIVDILAFEDEIPGLVRKKKLNKQDICAADCIMCIDIGTTTIAAVLIEPESGTVLKSTSCVNRQRAWGADVISRVRASISGAGEALQQAVLSDLAALEKELCGSVHPAETVISCNTVMGHLLQGWNCETLGAAPYRPVDLSLRETQWGQILPGVSAFIGGDIVSGICSLDMDRREELTALIDLGTNGEMAVGNRDGILTTSTAAGPAFEGIGISCGTAGIPGAISGVTLKGEHVETLWTIEGEPPAGICGSGVVEIMAELLKNSVADAGGLLKDPYFDEGFTLTGEIRFTQKDIRAVQMAKAAIRAGFETLLQQRGIRAEQISQLYLAGGFGQKINIGKACAIGMLPATLASQTIAVGNSSLAGAVRFAREPSMRERMVRTAAGAEELLLAESSVFQEAFLSNMNF